MNTIFSLIPTITTQNTTYLVPYNYNTELSCFLYGGEPTTISVENYYELMFMLQYYSIESSYIKNKDTDEIKILNKSGRLDSPNTKESFHVFCEITEESKVKALDNATEYLKEHLKLKTSSEDSKQASCSKEKEEKPKKQKRKIKTSEPELVSEAVKDECQFEDVFLNDDSPLNIDDMSVNSKTPFYVPNPFLDNSETNYSTIDNTDTNNDTTDNTEHVLKPVVDNLPPTIEDIKQEKQDSKPKNEEDNRTIVNSEYKVEEPQSASSVCS
ncbi:hypothetical protein CDIK_2995 [Cucumispora dikerogammari]|nr:hypothetical protein CDIK_2995 [Cucumispora dikerogammari]